MASLHVISGLAHLIQNPGCAYALNHVECAYQMPVFAFIYCYTHLYEWLLTTLQRCKIYVSSLKILWYGSTEWNMEENFSVEWNIFGMEWKRNERKLPVWNMEKSSSIPYHVLAASGHYGLGAKTLVGGRCL